MCDIIDLVSLVSEFRVFAQKYPQWSMVMQEDAAYEYTFFDLREALMFEPLPIFVNRKHQKLSA
jgi:hypothetical protein